MNVSLPIQLDKPGFWAWSEGREELYELVGGRVVMMVRPVRGHQILVMNLAFALRAQLDPRWIVLAEFGLDTGPATLRFPDIVVDRAGGAASDRTATTPVLAAEVLSPSSIDVDLVDKPAEYLSLPSLEAYLVLAQSEPKAWLWERRDGGFPDAANVLSGTEQMIRIAALGLVLPLGSLYAGL
jgi:Uma2 family endonuclease